MPHFNLFVSLGSNVVSDLPNRMQLNLIFLQMLAINFVLSEPGLMAQAVMCPHTIELKFFSANKRLY